MEGLLFLIKVLRKPEFWFLFLASLTLFLMMTWRTALRDAIFKMI